MAAGFSRSKVWIDQEVLSHTDLNGEYDNILNNVAVANGIASLNSSTKVVEDPANATATPTASKIPIANASGKLAISWLNEPIDNFTSSDTLTAIHTTCLFDHATVPVTLTLPIIGTVSSSTYQKVYRFRNIKLAVGTIGGTVDGVTNPTLAKGESLEIYGDGTTWRVFSNSKTDAINELTAAAGVTVDGCLIKDGAAALATLATTASSLTMQGEDSATATTAATSLDLGTVTSGDRIFVMADISGLSGVTTGVHATHIDKASGTATIETYHSVGDIQQASYLDSISQRNSASGIIKVTGSGTLVLQSTHLGAGMTTYLNQIYAFFLKKQ